MVQTTFLSEALTVEANREIAAAVKEKRPFYLNMAHYAVHSPFQADKRFLSRYTDPDKSDQAKAFATLIEGCSSIHSLVSNRFCNVYHQVADYRETGRTPRLNSNGVTVFETTHINLQVVAPVAGP